MTTFTLTLPDELTARLAELPRDAVNAYAVAAFTPLIDGTADDEEEDEDGEPDPDLIAALRAGLAEEEAGNLLTLEEARERFEAGLVERLK